MTTSLTIEERLARLESQNRQLRKIGLICAGVACSAILSGAAAFYHVPDEIVAKSFLLKDDDGHLYGRFSGNNGQPQLVLYDKSGDQRIKLEVDGVIPTAQLSRITMFGLNRNEVIRAEGSASSVISVKNEDRSSVSLCAFGTRPFASVVTRPSPQDEHRAYLGSDRDGSHVTMQHFRSGGHSSGVVIDVNDDQPRIQLNNSSDAAIWSAP